MSLRIAMVAGEPSGDRLGAGLLIALQAREQTDAFGIGGPHLVNAQLELMAPMAQLTMHGFAEPIRRLPMLWRLLRRIEDRVVAENVDVFIGVDFNVFNLLLERRLQRHGIKTVHYVSPSVYAWRRGRIKRIAKSADLLLALFPFEPPLYAKEPLRAVFVGHPLADEIQPRLEAFGRREHARAAFSLRDDDVVVCLMPGSRRSEIHFMLQPFLEAAALFHRQHPNAVFLLPCANDALMQVITRIAKSRSYQNLPLKIIAEPASEALAASDVALVKSGTSTLEAMLLGIPMVVGYRLGYLSYQLVKRLLRTPFIALPNILAGQALVPELLQSAMQPQALAAQLQAQLKPARRAMLLDAFDALHTQLRGAASERGAREVRHLVGRA